MANLDALFDRFLVSFDDQGKLMVSPRLSAVEMQKLGLILVSTHLSLVKKLTM